MRRTARSTIDSSSTDRHEPGGQTGAVKAQSQSQSLYIRELQAQIDRLEQARQRNLSIPIDASVPYFVPMALGAAYFRSGQFAMLNGNTRSAIDANPNSGETHTNLAVLYMMTVGSIRPNKEVTLAEQTGFHVHPGLKDDLIEKGRAARSTADFAHPKSRTARSKNSIGIVELFDRLDEKSLNSDGSLLA